MHFVWLSTSRFTPHGGNGDSSLFIYLTPEFTVAIIQWKKESFLWQKHQACQSDAVLISVNLLYCKSVILKLGFLGKAK